MPLNLIFMGTPQFALPALHALVQARHRVTAVYTAPPRPAGRGQKERITPIHEYALAQNMRVLTPATLREAQVQQEFANFKADAAVVAAYGLLLPAPILAGTKFGCINIHPSLLPRWRGAAPIQRTVMAGDKETGVVIMRMDAGLDTGDILLTERYAIPDGTTAGELHDTLAQKAAPLLLRTLQGLAAGTITAIKQPADGVTYAKKITKEDCRIDWSKPAHDIRQQVLGLSPEPGAVFAYKGEAIKLLRADILPSSTKAAPGTVIDNRLLVQCGDGALLPLVVQRPGKKPMPVGDMLRGHPIPAGEIVS